MPSPFSSKRLLTHTFPGSTSLSIFIILAIILFFAALLGGFAIRPDTTGEPLAGGGSVTTVTDSGAFCCNDASCGRGKAIQYNGITYNLLVSSFYSSEHNKHFHFTGVTPSNADGAVYTLNQADAHDEGSCSNHQAQGLDTYRQPQGSNPGCYTVATGTFIFVCRSGDAACQDQANGSKAAVWDAYIKQGAAVPSEVSSCTKRTNPNDPPVATIAPLQQSGSTASGPQTVVTLAPGQAHYDLQLQTFGVTVPPQQIVVREPFIADALSPYCKPAIYLYPPQMMAIHVEVSPKNPLTLTIPQYPTGGWDVLAYPGSQIQYKQAFYPYLYYETKLPDSLAQKPQNGYVIPSDKVHSFLPEILSKLGLNETERREFVDYWVNVLPKSPYYFIGVMDQSTLDAIAPLTIIPKPDHTLRITLYFQALDHEEAVIEPVLPTVQRTGFTAVEWGGIFKKDKTHAFSCFM